MGTEFQYWQKLFTDMEKGEGDITTDTDTDTDEEDIAEQQEREYGIHEDDITYEYLDDPRSVNQQKADGDYELGPQGWEVEKQQNTPYFQEWKKKAYQKYLKNLPLV